MNIYINNSCLQCIFYIIYYEVKKYLYTSYYHIKNIISKGDFMAQRITISVADAVYNEIELKKGDTNRSEYVEELIRVGLGWSPKKTGDNNVESKQVASAQ